MIKLKRFIITILAATFILSFAFISGACEDDYYFADGEYFYVSLSVYAGVALRSNALSQNIRYTLPKDGYILPARKIRIERRTTVLSLSESELEREEIPFSVRENGFIAGIGGLYDRAIGAQSGWIFFVNGAFATRGAGATVIRASDVIEWRYTARFGDDGL